ncbi:MAG: DUF962 domain-containing protein [Bdellovibrionales bacterium]|nr:DUF962 domain-containing protein [Bdellovibrionales bacterium]
MSRNLPPFKTFKDFYPFYLVEHSNRTNQWLHWTGTFLLLLNLGRIANAGTWVDLWQIPVLGYGFAWFGHFVVEKNRPATFKHPFYSLMGDFVMFYHLSTGQGGAGGKMERLRQEFKVRLSAHS